MAAQAQPPVEPDADERSIERAVEIAWRALSRRERTVAELRAFLERRSVPAEAIHAATAELAAAGYLDDAAYARRFAEDRRQLDRWGSERIARDLARRGVAEEHVAAALAEQDGGERERAAARALLSERFPEPPADDPARDRAWRLLVRRGYAPQLAYEAVRAHARAPREPPPTGADRRLHGGAPGNNLSNSGRRPVREVPANTAFSDHHHERLDPRRPVEDRERSKGTRPSP